VERAESLAGRDEWRVVEGHLSSWVSSDTAIGESGVILSHIYVPCHFAPLWIRISQQYSVVEA